MASPESFDYVPPPGSARITPKQWGKFFEVLAAHGVVRRACREAGISPFSAYYHVRVDKLFEERFNLCKEMGADALDEEAYRRAVEGVDKPVFHMGMKIADVKEYSDHLLTLLLKGARPEKYKDRSSVEVKGQVVRGDLSSLTDEEIEEMLARKRRAD